MQTAIAARTISLSAFTGLTYIDSLVSGATAQGLFSINVAPSILSTATITTLRSNGFTVSEKYNSMDDPTAPPSWYVISW